MIHDICLYFALCEIKKLVVLYLYFPHMHLCVLFKYFKKNTSWFSQVAVYSCN